MLKAVRRGTEMVCSNLSVDALAVTQEPAHQMPARVIRRALLAATAGQADPRGLRIRGARITGQLDLTHAYPAIGLGLINCAFDQGIELQDAHLPWLSLTGSHVPQLIADRMQTDGVLKLDTGFHVVGSHSRGAVCLVAAHIRGQLDMSGAHLVNQSGLALGDPHTYGTGTQGSSMNAAGDRLQETARATALALPGTDHGYPFTEHLDVYKVPARSSSSSPTTRRTRSSRSSANPNTLARKSAAMPPSHQAATSTNGTGSRWGPVPASPSAWSPTRCRTPTTWLSNGCRDATAPVPSERPPRRTMEPTLPLFDEEPARPLANRLRPRSWKTSSGKTTSWPRTPRSAA
ncbi:hypothetical protein [Amycolatopsis melonis]|uniref:hypothetical protein n=1 Tax=Amycolatopsis melonis TaxID=3156488 RepID=UPI0032B521F3